MDSGKEGSRRVTEVGGAEEGVREDVRESSEWELDTTEH